MRNLINTIGALLLCACSAAEQGADSSPAETPKPGGKGDAGGAGAQSPKPGDKADAGGKAAAGGNAQPTVPLCDGTESLKLRVYIAGSNERESRGSIVRIENGIPSIGIDGLCNYYMGGAWFEDRNARVLGWRKGKVDAEFQSALEQKFPLANLGTLQDCGSAQGVFDATPQIIASASSRAMCLVAGPKFMDAWNVIKDRAEALWAAAKPMDGPMWISMAAKADDLPAYDWPLSEPMSTFLIPDTGPGAGTIDFMSGAGHRIADADALTKLRELRERYLSDAKATPGRYFEAPKVTDGTVPARLYMRDALPYEDEHGLWPTTTWAR